MYSKNSDISTLTTKESDMTNDRFARFIGGSVKLVSHLNDIAYGVCAGIELDDYFCYVFVEHWSASPDSTVPVTPDERIYKILKSPIRYLESSVIIMESSSKLEILRPSFSVGGLYIERVEHESNSGSFNTQI